jgi:hypothetical protein
MEKMLYLFLVVIGIFFAVGSWYLHSSKIRYERWVDSKFPLPHRLKFVSDEEMKDVVRPITLNGEIRELRTIVMAISISGALFITVFLIAELVTYFLR